MKTRPTELNSDIVIIGLPMEMVQREVGGSSEVGRGERLVQPLFQQLSARRSRCW